MTGAEWTATIPGVGAVIGTVLVFANSRKELRQKSAADYVTLTKAAADLVLEQITTVRTEAKADRERCERNIIKLRAALLAAGVTVPELEYG